MPERTEIECVIERVKQFGLTLCADFDEDCQKVTNHEGCWRYEDGTGVCPYLCVRT